ncbi:MAG: sugar ABC transporter ATP-binding protein [Caldilineales bacterium]|nr:sugar ABC transporter ATP-binding protein [Caldilineales bacterium]
MEHVSKSFPGVQALDDVNLYVDAGEVLGLIGQNGAGKSTLMKILSGVYGVDQGAIYLEGEPTLIRDPHHAQTLGISIIYQELNLMPNLTVMENIFIGREPGSSLFYSRKQAQQQAQTILDRLNLNIHPTEIVRDLSVAEQQMVEIAKSISRQVKVLILDEPTSALSESEVDTLFGVIQELKLNNIGIIFISHRLEEVLHLCDRVTVLRDGRHVGDLEVRGATKDDLIRMMVGRSLETYFHQDDPEVSRAIASSEDIVLEVRNLSRKGAAQNPTAEVLHNVSIGLRQGEILGLAGLIGAGRTELARCIFGADSFESGEIFLEGKPVTIRSPQDAISLGIGLLPEDRKEQGLILTMAVRQNMSLVNLDAFTRLGLVGEREEGRTVQDYIDRFQIRTPGMDRRVVNLSGGNQQKVVISKWLMVSPKILIMDEPTRGIDVGAKSEIYDLMHQLAARGISIIMISSEFPELLAMCDRIVCMTEGRVTETLAHDEATLEKIMHACTLRQHAIIKEGAEA